MSNRIFHILTDDKKFTQPFIDIITENFGTENHFFLTIKKNSPIFSTKKKNSLITVFLELKNADKIILHGLFSFKVLLLLLLLPSVRKKSYWVMWGGDLYCRNFDNYNLKQHIKECCRKKVIPDFLGLITYITGDYKLAQKWYGTSAKYYECLMYPSNVYNNHISIKKTIHSKRTIKILVGNSADKTNKHFDILNKLLAYQHQEIKIYCPLSYGDKEYASEVSKRGNELFQEKFISLTSFIPFNDYIQLLGDIDIAIFAHERQQAMGNTIFLLGLGKKVYLRNDVTQWNTLEHLGVKVYNTKNINLERIPIKTASDNMEIIKDYFHMERLISQWSSIFK